MKKFSFILLLILTARVYSSVVLNEVFYDPVGPDAGYEWLELYNPTDAPIDMEGWILEKAQTTFTEIDTLESIIIPAKGFLLIGEEFVEDADIKTTLAFTNAGSSTNGVRISCPDTDYTDTVLYHEPNSDELTWDCGVHKIPFVPTVQEGNSLARKYDGVDTDLPKDWFECTNLTPGAPNLYPIDLAIFKITLQKIEGIYHLFTFIHNLSTEGVDNSEAHVDIFVNNNLFDSYELPAIAPMDSLEFSCPIGTLEDGLFDISTRVELPNDINPENNQAGTSILIGESPIVFNEIMFRPSSGRSEWFELYNRSTRDYQLDDFLVTDYADREIRFSAYIAADDYLVVCRDSLNVMLYYPNTPFHTIVEADSWAPLNVGGDVLTLFDNYELQLEQMEYSGDGSQHDVSLERVNPYLPPTEDNWGYSVIGATPGRQNSIYVVYLPTQASITANPNPFAPRRGEYTIISFSLPEVISRVTVRIFDIKGRLVRKLANQVLQAYSGDFVWNGYSEDGRRLPVGVYIINLEATSQESEKVYTERETVVIAR
jgi:hypothetical protein